MSRLDSEIPDECPQPRTRRRVTCAPLLPRIFEARDNLERKLLPLNIPIDVLTLLGLNGSIPKHTQMKIVISLIAFLLESHLIERI
jgi:hypothetical protein